MVDLTSYSFLEETERVEIKTYRYQPGFMHQKVLLIDDDSTTIGTANFDNRSMRLNFEVTMLMKDAALAAKVERMLLADFANSRVVYATDYTNASAPFQFSVKTARLLAPVQSLAQTTSGKMLLTVTGSNANT